MKMSEEQIENLMITIEMLAGDVRSLTTEVRDLTEALEIMRQKQKEAA